MILNRKLEQSVLKRRLILNEKNVIFQNSHEFIYILSYYGRCKFGLYSGDFKIFKDNIEHLTLEDRIELFDYYSENFMSFAVFYDTHIDIMSSFNIENILDLGLQKNNIYFNRLCLEISVFLCKFSVEEAAKYCIEKNSTYLFDSIGESVKKKLLLTIPSNFKQYGKELCVFKKGNSLDEEALANIENEEYLKNEENMIKIEKTVDYLIRHELLWNLPKTLKILLDEGYLSEIVYSSRIFCSSTQKRHLCNFPLEFSWLYGIVHKDEDISNYFSQFMTEEKYENMCKYYRDEIENNS